MDYYWSKFCEKCRISSIFYLLLLLDIDFVYFKYQSKEFQNVKQKKITENKKIKWRGTKCEQIKFIENHIQNTNTWYKSAYK